MMNRNDIKLSIAQHLYNWDVRWFTNINCSHHAQRPILLNSIMWFFSTVGDAVIASLLGVLLLYCCDPLCGPKLQDAFPIISFIGIACILGLIVTHILKNAVGRWRPLKRLHQSIVSGELIIHTQIKKLRYRSFPSGHTQNAFTLFVVSWLLYHNILLSSGVIVFAIIVGYSRIYVGAHFPLDVIAGSIIGIACGFIALRVWELFIFSPGIFQWLIG